VQPAELIRTARAAVGELTGFTPENVTGFERDGDGWIVTVEVLELERVPSTTDVIGSYEITVGDDGEIQGFRRRRRYARGAADRED
jgi:hypothetical protein